MNAQNGKRKMTKLTEQQLQRAAKPGPKPFEVVVGPTPGLRLCVQPSAKMSWCLRYRVAGRGRKMVFARYPGLPLPEARKVAAGLYGQVASGRDPGQERKASRRREVEAKARSRHGREDCAPISETRCGQNPRQHRGRGMDTRKQRQRTAMLTWTRIRCAGRRRR
jgi:hypothetical protein